MLRLLPITLLWACSEYDIATFDGVDVFYQDPPAQVDVLLVVDNSGSMQPFQNKLAEEFDGFVSFFESAKVDYQIGVVTSSVAPVTAAPAYGCPQSVVDLIPAPGVLVDHKIIDADTPDAEEVFADLVKVGTCGSATEMGIEASWLALGLLGDMANLGFLRADAMLSILYVSDEQDSSARAVAEYLNDFQTQVKSPDVRGNFNVSGFVVTDPANCEGQQSANARLGSRYLEMIEATDGIQADICADDYSRKIEDLSVKAARLTEIFYLSKEPAADTIVVEIDGEEQPCQDGRWSFIRADNPDGDEGDVPAILFDRSSLPPSGSTILVSYFSGNGDTEGFCPDDATVVTP